MKIILLSLLSLRKIPDPTAVKPDDWDVPPQIADPSASKPENWLDDEEDMISGEPHISSSDFIILIQLSASSLKTGQQSNLEIGTLKWMEVS